MSIVRWTDDAMALRISMNQLLLDEMGWDIHTRLRLDFKRNWIWLRKNKYGNRLHKRGTGEALSFITQMYPGELLAMPCSSRIIKPNIGEALKLYIPVEFYKGVP